MPQLYTTMFNVKTQGNLLVSCLCCCCLSLGQSHVGLCVTPWTVACQDPLSMGILQARIVEWVAIPSSRDLPDPGIKPRSPALQEDSLPLSHQGSPNCVYQGVDSPSEDFLFPRRLTFFPDS